MFRFDRRLLLNFDWGLLATVLIVAAMGLANLYSATYSPGAGASSYFIKQLTYYLILQFCVFCDKLQVTVFPEGGL